MTSRSDRPTPEGMERAARELTGLSLSPNEMKALLGRLQSVREELRALAERIGPACEPLPSVIVEDEVEPWPRT